MAPQSSRSESLPHSCDQRSISGPPVNLNVAVNGVLSLSSSSASRASTSANDADAPLRALGVGRAAEGPASAPDSTCATSDLPGLPFATPESGKHVFRSEDDKEGTRNQHATSDKSNSDSDSHSTISNTSNYPKVDTEPQPAHPTDPIQGSAGGVAADSAIFPRSESESESESGQALRTLIAPVSAENCANGISGCLPAHHHLRLGHDFALVNTTRIEMSASTSARVSASTATASTASAASTPTPTPIAPTGTRNTIQYERDAYDYHRAQAALHSSAPSRADVTGGGDPCAESSAVSVNAIAGSSSSSTPLRVTSWNISRNGNGSGSGITTPAALDTPAYRTPLGVYNGLVNGHRDDKEGYFPSSSSASSSLSSNSSLLSALSVSSLSSASSVSSVLSGASASLQLQNDYEETKQTRQPLSLLSLPPELVAHILRMGYFSHPEAGHAKVPNSTGSASGSRRSTTSGSSSGPAPNSDSPLGSGMGSSSTSASYTYRLRSGANLPSERNPRHPEAVDEREHESDQEHEQQHEYDTPPTITCDPDFRFTLLHTCRSLRAAVFSDPALWGTVRLGPRNGEGGVRKALGPSPFTAFAGSPCADGLTYLGHQLSLARAHPLRISLTAFWGVERSEEVFSLLTGAGAHGVKEEGEGTTRRWEAFELVCPREDELALLARVTANCSFPNLRYMSLTFIGRSSGTSVAMPIPASAEERRERRARDGRPGARFSVGLPSGAFGGWRAGALPALRGLLLRNVDLEGVVEDVLEHEYDSQHDVEYRRPIDVFNSSAWKNDLLEPALPSLRTLYVRGHGLWPTSDALDAFFTRHAPSVQRLGIHVRSGDMLREVFEEDTTTSSSATTSTSTSPNSALRIPSLRVLEVDTSEGLNRDTARLVRLLTGSAVCDGDPSRTEMRRVVVKESGGAENEELMRWSRSLPGTSSSAARTRSEARLAITNSAISSAISALPPAMLRPVGVLALDVPSGEGGWGDACRLRELFSVFGQAEASDASIQPEENTENMILGCLRRVEVLNADVLGLVREILAPPPVSSAVYEDEAAHDDDNQEDDWEHSLSSTGLAEPICSAQELVISLSDANDLAEDLSLAKATVAFASLFDGPSSSTLSGAAGTSLVTPSSSMPVSTHALGSLKALTVNGAISQAQVAAVVSSMHASHLAPSEPRLCVHDARS